MGSIELSENNLNDLIHNERSLCFLVSRNIEPIRALVDSVLESGAMQGVVGRNEEVECHVPSASISLKQFYLKD